MPYLHCPRCHRTAWTRRIAGEGVECRGCGTRLSTLNDGDARLLANAVRERFARDAQRDADRIRFVRDPQRLAE